MGERQQYSPEGWLDLATADIRFKPDRAAVRAELKAHLEDKCADLRRLYPEMNERELDALATRQMGDPEEVGRAQGGWTVWGAGLSVFPVGEGPSPVPLPRTTLSGIREEWDGETPYGVPFSAGPMLFLQMPEEAVRGTLEIWEEQPGEDGTRTAPLECRLHPLEAGIWLAALEAEVTAVDAWQPYLGAPYTLRLYGEDGGLLLEQRGTIPEEL